MRAGERGEAGGLKRSKRSGRATVWGIEALTGGRSGRFALDRLYPTTGPSPEQTHAQDTSIRGEGGWEKKKAWLRRVPSADFSAREGGNNNGFCDNKIATSEEEAVLEGTCLELECERRRGCARLCGW